MREGQTDKQKDRQTEKATYSGQSNQSITHFDSIKTTARQAAVVKKNDNAMQGNNEDFLKSKDDYMMYAIC